MAPAKRRKTGQNLKDPVTAPSTMADVPPVCLGLRDWINELHSYRHGVEEEKPWPLGKGGSFLDIVQKCFQHNNERLLTDSLTFAKTIGMVGRDADMDTFAQKFLVKMAHRKL